MVSITSFPVGSALLRMAGFQPRVKRADEIVNNSAVLQNDNDLLVAVEATSTYLVLICAIYRASAVADFQTAFAIPAGAELDGVKFPDLTGSNWQRNVSTGPESHIGDGVAIDGTFLYVGRLVVAGTAGNLTLQWAQNTAEATDCTVRLGSWMLVLKVA